MKVDYEKLKKEASALGIQMIILFGSQATGKAHADSDYDVAVLMVPEKNIGENMDDYTKTLFFLAEALCIPDQKLDLTNLNNASPFLQKEIFANCKLIFGDAYKFASFKSFALREYIATSGLRDLRSKIIIKRQGILAEKIYG